MTLIDGMCQISQYVIGSWPFFLFRIAIATPFSGLRRFPQGHGFKQWTGDDSKALMKVCPCFSYCFLWYYSQYITGLSASDIRSCACGNSANAPCVPWLLLHRSPECSRLIITSTVGGRPQAFSWTSDRLSRMWSSPHWILSTSPTFTHSLFANDPRIWCSEWLMLFNHGVKAHQGCQRAMATLESIWSTWPDVTDQPAPRQTCCVPFWL